MILLWSLGKGSQMRTNELNEDPNYPNANKSELTVVIDDHDRLDETNSMWYQVLVGNDEFLTKTSHFWRSKFHKCEKCTDDKLLASQKSSVVKNIHTNPVKPGTGTLRHRIGQRNTLEQSLTTLLSWLITRLFKMNTPMLVRYKLHQVRN